MKQLIGRVKTIVSLVAFHFSSLKLLCVRQNLTAKILKCPVLWMMGKRSQTDRVLYLLGFELCECIAYSQNLIILCILKT